MSDKKFLDKQGLETFYELINGKLKGLQTNIDKVDSKILFDNDIVWGEGSKSGNLYPIEAGYDTRFCANRLSFMHPNYIKVEYSNNGSSNNASWKEYPNLTNSDKTSLVTTGLEANLYLGNNNVSQIAYNDALRITITGTTPVLDQSASSTTGYVWKYNTDLYFSLRKIFIKVSTENANNCKVKVEQVTDYTYSSTKGGTENAPRDTDTKTPIYTQVGVYDISGWSGWNSISWETFENRDSSKTKYFGGTLSSHIKELRFTFYFESNTAKDAKFKLMSISMQGENAWSINSGGSYAKFGHLYSIDANKNAIFPSNITAKGGFFTDELPANKGVQLDANTLTLSKGLGFYTISKYKQSGDNQNHSNVPSLSTNNHNTLIYLGGASNHGHQLYFAQNISGSTWATACDDLFIRKQYTSSSNSYWTNWDRVLVDNTSLPVKFKNSLTVVNNLNVGNSSSNSLTISGSAGGYDTTTGKLTIDSKSSAGLIFKTDPNYKGGIKLMSYVVKDKTAEAAQLYFQYINNDGKATSLWWFGKSDMSIQLPVSITKSLTAKQTTSKGVYQFNLNNGYINTNNGIWFKEIDIENAAPINSNIISQNNLNIIGGYGKNGTPPDDKQYDENGNVIKDSLRQDRIAFYVKGQLPSNTAEKGNINLFNIGYYNGDRCVWVSSDCKLFDVRSNLSISKDSTFLLNGHQSNEIKSVNNDDGSIQTNSPLTGSKLISIRKALDFRWYSDHYQIGNIRGGGESSLGFGITKDNDKLIFRAKYDTNDTTAGGAIAWVGNKKILHAGNCAEYTVGTASNANKLTDANSNGLNIGTANKPVYFDGGIPKQVTSIDNSLINKSPGTSTLSWNTEVTLGTIAGQAIKAKLPAEPTTDLSNYYNKTEVGNQITNAINNLDKTDTAVTGQFVSKVTQTDGKITVTRATLPKATTSTIGGIKTGFTASGNDIPVKIDTNGNAYVTIGAVNPVMISLNDNSSTTVYMVSNTAHYCSNDLTNSMTLNILNPTSTQTDGVIQYSLFVYAEKNSIIKYPSTWLWANNSPITAKNSGTVNETGQYQIMVTGIKNSNTGAIKYLATYAMYK